MTQVLVVGIGDFEHKNDGEETESLSPSFALEPLPSVEAAVRDLAKVMGKMPGLSVRSGSSLHDLDCGSLKKQWRDAYWKALESVPGDALIVHFAGHGIAGGQEHSLYLAAADTDRRNVAWTASPVDEWLNQIESTQDGPPVLLVLDVCGAGRAALRQRVDGIRAAARRAWVIAACADDEKTYAARFTRATTAVLSRLRGGWLDLSPTLEHIPVETLAREINRELARSAEEEGVPAQSVLCTSHSEACAPVPPFFANPSYRETPGGRYRQSMENGLWQFAAAVDPALDAVHFISRASGAPRQEAITQRCYFTGRQKPLAEIKQWIEGNDPARLMVVTGSPGVGKSALLGVVACLAHPHLRPVCGQIQSQVPRVVRPELNPRLAAVHARQRGPGEVMASIAAQLELGEVPAGGWSPEALAQRIASQESEPVTLIVDALDEASLDIDLLEKVLLPLSRRQRQSRPSNGESPSVGMNPVVCRVLIGTRPWWDRYRSLKEEASHSGRILDLDEISNEERQQEFTDYLAEVLEMSPAYCGLGTAGLRLQTAEAVAERLVQRHDDGAFLLVSLFAHYLLGQDSPPPIEEVLQRIPSHLPGMLELHLDVLSQEHPAMPAVLAAVAHGYGQGMPLEVVQSVTPTFAGRSAPAPDLIDTWEALQAASFYLRFSADSDGRRLYRFYHQSLVDHLRRATSPSQLRNFHERILDTLPGPIDLASRNWELALPYVLRHAAQHAVDARDLDRLLSCPSFLVHCDPQLLREALGSERTLRGRITALICWAALSPRHEPQQRREWLRNTAHAWNETWLMRELDALDENLTQEGERAQLHPGILTFAWGTVDRRYASVIEDEDEAGEVAAFARFGGRWLVILATAHGGWNAWDVRTGILVQSLVPQEDCHLTALDIGENGTTTLIAGGTAEGQLFVWDLDTLDEQQLQIDGSSVVSLAIGQWEDAPVVLSSGGGELAVHDLAGRRLASVDILSSWLTELESAGRVEDLWEPDHDVARIDCTAVAMTVLDNAPLIVAGAVDGSLHVWNANGTAHRTWPGGTARITALQILHHATGPVAVALADDGVGIWDLRTGSRRVLPWPGHDSKLVALQCEGVLRETRLVSVGPKGEISVQSLADGEVTRSHTRTSLSAQRALAVASEGPRLMIARQHSWGVGLWSQSDRDSPLTEWAGHDCPLEAVASTATLNGAFAVSVDAQGLINTWDTSTGTLLASLFVGDGQPPTAVTAGTLEGEPVAVVATGMGKRARSRIIKMTDGTVVQELKWDNTILGLQIGEFEGKPALTARTRTECFISQLMDAEPPISFRDTLEHYDPVRSHAWGSDGEREVVLLGHDSGLLSVKGRDTSRTFRRHRLSVTSLTTGVLDDRGVVAFGDEQGSVVVACMSTGKVLKHFQGHRSEVTLVRLVEPDGIPLLVTSGEDDTVRIWEPMKFDAPLAEISFPATLVQADASSAGIFAAFKARIGFYAWADLSPLQQRTQDTGE
ncbi:hypothetical protein GCM10009864_59450 [Streptomyces lunalinharesii]|uniref:Uncharacterized protein n=1 Tax=Streptomyces lunalinharesii TaxID=333384 RepID=A0ABN3SM41_9ACTN